MSVLIAIDQPKLAEIYSSNLKIYTNQPSVIANKSTEAINLIKLNPEFKVVIIQQYFNGQNFFEKVYKTISQKGKEVLLICMEKIPKQEFYEEVVFAKDTSDLKTLVSSVAKKFEITAHMMANLKVPSFFEFKPAILLPLIKYEVDIYILIEGVYKTLLNAGQSFDDQRIKNLKTKNIPIFVKNFDRLTFINSSTSGLIKLLDSGALNLKNRIEATKSGFDLVHNNITEMGIDEGTVKLANATIGSMLKTVSQSKSFKQLFKELSENSDSYKYQHSMTTLYIGTKIIDEAEWGSKDLLNKLAYVAFFADVSLHNDHLCEIQKEYGEEWDALREEDQKLVKRHALESAKILSKFKRLPMGVESLVKTHHGSKSGIGLTMDTFNLAPTGLIYMIASEFAAIKIKAQRKNTDINKEMFVEYLKKNYGKNPKFKDYIYYFESIKL